MISGPVNYQWMVGAPILRDEVIQDQIDPQELGLHRNMGCNFFRRYRLAREEPSYHVILAVARLTIGIVAGPSPVVGDVRQRTIQSVKGLDVAQEQKPEGVIRTDKRKQKPGGTPFLYLQQQIATRTAIESLGKCIERSRIKTREPFHHLPGFIALNVAGRIPTLPLVGRHKKNRVRDRLSPCLMRRSEMLQSMAVEPHLILQNQDMAAGRMIKCVIPILVHRQRTIRPEVPDTFIRELRDSISRRLRRIVVVRHHQLEIRIGLVQDTLDGRTHNLGPILRWQENAEVRGSHVI